MKLIFKYFLRNGAYTKDEFTNLFTNVVIKCNPTDFPNGIKSKPTLDRKKYSGYIVGPLVYIQAKSSILLVGFNEISGLFNNVVTKRSIIEIFRALQLQFES